MLYCISLRGEDLCYLATNYSQKLLSSMNISGEYFASLLVANDSTGTLRFRVVSSMFVDYLSARG